jgi:iron complex outermembrane receptor protein
MHQCRVWLLSSVSLLAMAGMAQAQTPPTQPTPQQLEITVTSQKREEVLRRVPATVDVIERRQIEERGVQGLPSLVQTLPNVGFADTGTRAGNSYLTIRGFRNNDRSLDPAASIFIDGVPFGDFLSPNQRLYDVERIEVLKGAQGSLYGVNSQAGVVNILTRGPTPTFRGWVGTSVDSRIGAQGNFGLSGPLVPGVLSFSLSGVLARNGGQFDNVVLGNSFNSGSDGAVRGKLRFTPNDRWQIDAGFFYSRAIDKTGYVYAPVNRASYMANAFVSPFALGRFDAAANAGDGALTTSTQYVNAKYFGDAFDMTAIAAFRQAKSTASFDFDLSPRNWFIANQTYKAQEQFYELRFASPRNPSAPFTWVAGVSHNRRDMFFDRPVDAFAGNPFGFPPGRRDFSGVARLDSINTGVFAEGTLRFFDQRLGLTLGGRYDFAQRGIDRTAFPGFPGLKADVDQGQFLPKVGLDWRVDDRTILYGNIAQGWKAGGVSPYAPTVATSFFRKETSWMYEAGMKSRLTDQLAINVAGFYNAIRDFQDEIRPNVAQVYLGNARRASTRGAEIEVTWSPTEQWDFRASAGFVRATYDDYLYNQATGFRLDGKAIRQVPEYNYALIAKYKPLPGLWLQGELIGLGPFREYNYNAAANTLAEFKIDGATLLNARIGYDWANYSLSAYVTNIADVRYFTNTISGAQFIGYREPLGILGERRTFGAQFKATF